MRWFGYLVLPSLAIFFASQFVTDHEAAGTIVLVEYLKDEVIVAADSRMTSNGVHKDSACKLVLFKNQGVFAAARIAREEGHLADGKPIVWDAFETAEQGLKLAYSQTANESKAILAARIWGDQAKKFFDQGLKGPSAKRFIDHIHVNNNYGCIVEGIFVTKDGIDLSVVHIEILLKDEAAEPHVEIKIDPPIGGGSFTAMGDTSSALEFINRTSARSQREIAKWEATLPKRLTEMEREEQGVIQIVKWAIEFGSDKIGGDVSAVAVDQNGVRWLQEPPHCNASH